MGFVKKAEVGQQVDFKNRQGDIVSGKVIRVAGDVYTVKIGSEDTRPVHHKFLTKLHPLPAPEQVNA